MSGRHNKNQRKKEFSRIGAIASAAVFAAAGVAQPAFATAVPQDAARLLTPHRAIYDMTLAEVRQGTDVSSARGAMYYRFEPRCDGWEVETRVSLRLNYGTVGDVEVVDTKWSFSSFETFDGKNLSFQVDHSRDDELLEVYDGDAFRDPDTGAGKASFYVPGDTKATLPDGTLFPARHLLHVLAKARAGKRGDFSTVFDGASIVNPYEVNTLIVEGADGGRFAGALPMRPAVEALDGERATAVPAKLEATLNKPLPVYRVRMAYFPVEKPASVPDFELEIDYRDDGIATHIKQDFGDFVLDLTPSRIEALPLPECSQ